MNFMTQYCFFTIFHVFMNSQYNHCNALAAIIQSFLSLEISFLNIFLIFFADFVSVEYKTSYVIESFFVKKARKTRIE